MSDAVTVSDDGKAEGSVLMVHDVGLHARPSVALTKCAKGFDAQIGLSVDGGESWVDAKSIVKVMATKAPDRTVLQFRAEGADAEAALGALIALVENEFDLKSDG